MIEMTPAARERVDNYLQRMRSELRGTRSVVPDEVEQSVREHIEIALAHSQSPVGATEVIGVLDRLGPPERWLADEDQETSRPFTKGILNGPDGWLLSYVAFGLFLVSAAFFPIGGFFLMLPAMLVSRAYVELARERGEPLGARRWLVYPAIGLVLAFAVGLLILAPPMWVIAVLRAEGLENFGISENREDQMQFVIGRAGVVFGSWWIIAAAFCAAFLKQIQFVFAPLLDGLGRKHFAVLAGIGALVLAGGVTLLSSL